LGTHRKKKENSSTGGLDEKRKNSSLTGKKGPGSGKKADEQSKG